MCFTSAPVQFHHHCEPFWWTADTWSSGLSVVLMAHHTWVLSDRWSPVYSTEVYLPCLYTRPSTGVLSINSHPRTTAIFLIRWLVTIVHTIYTKQLTWQKWTNSRHLRNTHTRKGIGDTPGHIEDMSDSQSTESLQMVGHILRANQESLLCPPHWEVWLKVRTEPQTSALLFLHWSHPSLISLMLHQLTRHKHSIILTSTSIISPSCHQELLCVFQHSSECLCWTLSPGIRHWTLLHPPPIIIIAELSGYIFAVAGKQPRSLSRSEWQRRTMGESRNVTRNLSSRTVI